MTRALSLFCPWTASREPETPVSTLRQEKGDQDNNGADPGTARTCWPQSGDLPPVCVPTQERSRNPLRSAKPPQLLSP